MNEYVAQRVLIVAERNGPENGLGNGLGSPPGTLLIWAGVDIPDFCLVCEGQTLNADEWPSLYAAIGQTFADLELIPDEDGGICLDNDSPTLNQDARTFTLPDFRPGVPEDIDG